MKEYIISDGRGTQAVILPEKGATVISLQHNGAEFLYRNQENLDSPERPRCGIPFLFPMFGRLTDRTYTWEGKPYVMDIHGFGHTSSWQVAEHREDALKLVLNADESTLAQYPFSFRVTLVFTVAAGALTIGQTYENLGDSPMPYNYGFHPYFCTEKQENLRVEATADTRIDLEGNAIPFGHDQVCVTVQAGELQAWSSLMGVHSPTVLHNDTEGRKLTMEFDQNFPIHVLWTWGEMPFLCVEPVNGIADGLNTGTYLTLAPGELAKATVSFRPEVL